MAEVRADISRSSSGETIPPTDRQPSDVSRRAARAELLYVLMLPNSSGPIGLDATGIKESHLNRWPGSH
jgi:hypothetical protein